MLGNSAKNGLAANKLSDFSIDHILNRAGVNYERKVQFLSSPEFLDCPRNTFLQSTPITNHSNTSVALNWLQYSRYHPPKLQRQSRNGPAKRTPGRLPRVPFTPEQLSTLEDAYQKSTYLSSEDANKLADRLDLSNVRVKIWFQNRRARERREKRDLQMRENYAFDEVDVETIEDSDNTSNSSE